MLQAARFVDSFSVVGGLTLLWSKITSEGVFWCKTLWVRSLLERFSKAPILSSRDIFEGFVLNSLNVFPLMKPL